MKGESEIKKILIVTDSFKGSLTSLEAGKAIEKGIIELHEDLEVEVIPVADGGEGTVEAVIKNSKGEFTEVTAKDLLLRNIPARYGLFNNRKSAIIEMAAISGLPLLSMHERNPMLLNTFGTGQLILDAINKGCNEVFVGLGGSATNDGGIGMASALGVRFIDKYGEFVKPIPKYIFDIKRIDIKNKDKRLFNASITILSDVNNPLCGEYGASRVYGTQKGADEIMIKQLDERLEYLADLTETEIGIDYRDVNGSGAAGGLGFGLLAFANAKIISGADFILVNSKVEDKIKHADIIITGEGKLDYQTKFDKLPMKIAKLAKKHNRKCICVSGILGNGIEEIKNDFFYEIYSIVNNKITIEESLKNPGENLTLLAKKINL
ncbi:MAG: glycerate kinase [Melioribacteraceae bacterium]|nr:glycerate kinase [Melioribacteraceae bacterium]